MITCNCIVQAGQISAETEAALRANLSDFAQRAFGEPAGELPRHAARREHPLH